MTELHTFKITSLKDGKQVTEEFKDIVHYSFIEGHTFWMKQKGVLHDEKDHGKFIMNQYWFSVKDIIRMESTGGKIIESKREMFEFKRDNLIG